MKNNVVIRDCKKADVPELQLLVEELYVTDAGPKAFIPDVSLTQKALKAGSKKGRLLIFERDGSIVGYAILIFFWSNEFAGDIVDVDEILVTRSARGSGVGTAFFSWLKREYKNQATGWSLQVKPTNKRAYKLYQAMGFRTSSNWHMYNIFAWDEKKKAVPKKSSATNGSGASKSTAGQKSRTKVRSSKAKQTKTTSARKAR
ncbi:MAG: GNAT family N-acetyltransferase [Candidatus Melainabacteria bacterium]|nr:GNAT family N-acetyltransferase [Candidatus Melainabacteria bacterium]